MNIPSTSENYDKCENEMITSKCVAGSDGELWRCLKCKSTRSIRSSIAKRVTSTFFHIFPHFFHIFPHFSSLPVHFPNSCCKLHSTKEKVRLSQDTFDGHFNFEPETNGFRKFEQGSTSKYFPQSCCISQHSDMKVLVRKNAEKRELSE